MLVDSHCHLDRLELDKIGGSLDAALDQAQRAGVGCMLCVCINLEHFPQIYRLGEQYPQVFASVGVHPSEKTDQEPTVEELVSLARQPGVIAIGETGLDYYYNEGDLDWQRERFRCHIRAARQAARPLIIHTRDAEQDTLQILREEGAAEAGGIMHCFTGSMDMARQCLELGFYISFSGIVTFKNATELQEIAKTIPNDRILVETDSPYLTPVPFRGKANQPAYVKYVAETLARLRNVSVETISRTTTENFYRLFHSISPQESSVLRD